VVVTSGRAKALDKKLVILLVDESRLLREPPQDNELWLVGNVESCKPCHAGFSVGRALVGFWRFEALA
jgi:hypothetical protein